jgi:hypothetical protein
MSLTAGHPDRVVPALALKSTPTLTAAQAADRFVLPWVQAAPRPARDGRAITRVIAESTDLLVLPELGPGLALRGWA